MISLQKVTCGFDSVVLYWDIKCNLQNSTWYFPRSLKQTFSNGTVVNRAYHPLVREKIYDIGIVLILILMLLLIFIVEKFESKIKVYLITEGRWYRTGVTVSSWFLCSVVFLPWVWIHGYKIGNIKKLKKKLK